MAPVAKMHTLGHDFIPEPIHAGGLRYHGMSPLVSLLKEHGDIEARSVHQRASFEAGVTFARAEGILRLRADPRHPRRHRRGARREGGRRGTRHPVQPVRSRSFRPVGVRALSRWLARGLRVPAREGRGRARRACPPSADREQGAEHQRAAPRLLGRAGARSTPSRPSTRCSPRSVAARAAARTWTGAAGRGTAPAQPSPEPAGRSRAARRRRAADRRPAQRTEAPSRPIDRSGPAARPAGRAAAILAGCASDSSASASSADRSRVRSGARSGRGPWSSPGRRRGDGPAAGRRDGDIDRGRRQPERGDRRAPTSSSWPGPPPACLALLDALAGPWRSALAPDAVVTDVASTKSAIVERAEALGLRFVGGHPMAGRETSGYGAADGRPVRGPALGHRPGRGRRGRRPGRGTRPSGRRATGADGSAEAHDEAVAAISHLPLVLAAALVEAVAGPGVDRATGGRAPRRAGGQPAGAT